MASALCLLPLLALLLPLMVADARQHMMNGGIIPVKDINGSDPAAIDLSQFAVSEYNKGATKKLVYQELLGGFAYFSEGWLVYDLRVVAKNESLPTSAHYKAQIFDNLTGLRKLNDFVAN